jgi:hypothetical protein
MRTTVGRYIIDLTNDPARGSVWTVHLSKRAFPFRRRVSSDWFLDEQQARQFAEQLAERLKSDSSLEEIRKRKPGWTLVQVPPEPSSGNHQQQ